MRHLTSAPGISFPTDRRVPASIGRVALRQTQGQPERQQRDGRRLTDGELVDRVRSGQTAAFGELVERHRGAVYRAALAALRNPADAEDVAQDALVLAFRKIDQFRGDASVRTWMVTIAWRLALSRRRSPLHRLRQMMSADGLERETTSQQPSAETTV